MVTRAEIEFALAEAQKALALLNASDYAARLAAAVAEEERLEVVKDKVRELYSARYKELRIATGLFVAVGDGTFLDPSPKAMEFCEKFFGWKWDAQDAIDRSSGAPDAPFLRLLTAVAEMKLSGDTALKVLRKDKEQADSAASAARSARYRLENERNSLVEKIQRAKTELEDFDKRAAKREEEKRKALALPEGETVSNASAKAYEERRKAVREKVRLYMPPNLYGGVYGGYTFESATVALKEFAQQALAAVADEGTDDK